jgi:hypothetical protein
MRRRVFGDAVISTAALLVLLLALTSLDDRVRDQVSGFVHHTPGSLELAGVGRQLRDIGTVVLDAAREQSLSHAPLMIFTLAATVLVLFMVRT